MSKEVFTLALSSETLFSDGGFVLDSSNNSNILYQVDFNSLFNNRNKLYSKCQVRCHLISTASTTTTIDAVSGILVLQGLGSGNTLGLNGIQLANMSPTNSTVSGTLTGFFYTVSTLNALNGSQVTQVPEGIRQFRIIFNSVAGTLQPNTSMPNYRITLQFELYD